MPQALRLRRLRRRDHAARDPELLQPPVIHVDGRPRFVDHLQRHALAAEFAQDFFQGPEITADRAVEGDLFDSLPAVRAPVHRTLRSAQGYALSALHAPSPVRPPSATAITVVSLWTSSPTYLSRFFMCLSPFLVVGFTATPMRIGPDALRATRVCGGKHASFFRCARTQL